MSKAVQDAGGTPEARGEAIGDVLISMFIVSLHNAQAGVDRYEQRHRNLHIAFALAAYRRDHGRYPKTLAALSPMYLDPVPGDLFSGQSLLYRPSDSGYHLYSVGPNGKDDGGRTADDRPRGDDIGVRLPLEPKATPR